MSSTLEVHNIQSNSFERARSMSRSRGQTAEEKAFEEMKKMLLSYEALTEKLMAENASLTGRVTLLESSLAQTQKLQKEALDGVKEETMFLRDELTSEKAIRVELQTKLEQVTKELQKTKEAGVDLNFQFLNHSHDQCNRGGPFFNQCATEWSGCSLELS